MELRRRSDGSYRISPKSIADALTELDEVHEQVRKLKLKIASKCIAEFDALKVAEAQAQQLEQGIKDCILDTGVNYEDATVKLTKVQGMRRSWNLEKLEAIVPRGIFKNIVKMEPDPDKINEYVAKGKLDSKLIAPAYEETPNAPYVKWTKKSDKSADAEAEADSLAEQLA